MLSPARRKQQSDSPSRSGLELAAIVLLVAGSSRIQATVSMLGSASSTVALSSRRPELKP